jgi:hypothetical protein
VEEKTFPVGMSARRSEVLCLEGCKVGHVYRPTLCPT